MVYWEQLKANAQNEQFFLKVDMEDLINFDNRLGEAIRQQPNVYIDIFEQACYEVYKQTLPDGYGEPVFQIQILSYENPWMLRDLQSNLLNRLIVVPGIITSASKS